MKFLSIASSSHNCHHHHHHHFDTQPVQSTHNHHHHTAINTTNTTIPPPPQQQQHHPQQQQQQATRAGQVRSGQQWSQCCHKFIIGQHAVQVAPGNFNAIQLIFRESWFQLFLFFIFSQKLDGNSELYAVHGTLLLLYNTIRMIHTVIV